MNVEDIDLATLAAALASRLSGRRVEGFVRGRTELRDILVDQLSCSALQAEQLIDTMVARRLLHFSGDPSRAEEGGVWSIEAGQA